MNISINFYNEKGTFRDKVDCQRAFKHQLGPKPLSQNSSIKLYNLRDRIDLRWKRKMEKIISGSRQFKAIRANVYIEHPELPISFRNTSFLFRNPKELSNRIANYIIKAIKSNNCEKNAHGVVSAEMVLKMVK